MILTPLKKFPNNVGDLGKIIVDTGFKWLPKVKKIAQSGHTAQDKLYQVRYGLQASVKKGNRSSIRP